MEDSSTNHRDIEQLRDMLEEKDKHIQDLTDTLTHFHVIQDNVLNKFNFLFYYRKNICRMINRNF